MDIESLETKNTSGRVRIMPGEPRAECNPDLSGARADVGPLKHFSFCHAGCSALRDTSNRGNPRGLKPAARNTETRNALARDPKSEIRSTTSDFPIVRCDSTAFRFICCAAIVIGTHLGGREVAAQAAGVPTTLTEASEALREGNYEDARAGFEGLRDDPAQRMEATLGLARYHLRVGNYDKAISVLQQLDANKRSDWHRLISEARRNLGQYKQAIGNLKEAIQIDTDDASARLALGNIQLMLGRRREAIETYTWFDQRVSDPSSWPRDAQWITSAALGFLRYTVLTQTSVPRRTEFVLSDMLERAYTRLDRTYWPARVASGELLRERYNNDPQEGSVREYLGALRINEHSPEALVGLGEVALVGWNFESAEHRAERALESNPNLAAAHHLLARKSILERRYDQAEQHADRALEINAHDLTALSLRAAASACRYDEAEVARLYKKVATINPRCGLYHRTVALALSGIRQYEASESHFLKAIEYEPTDSNARAELGMMYMQWGLEDKARAALDAAWVVDPYNQRAKFTLELLDSIGRFEQYESPHFIVRFDSVTDPGLGAYVADYLERIYPEITEDYNTPLEHKTIIEFFPTHRAFGVRITGNPWIHTIGACTGRVIALSSPRNDPNLMGTYNVAHVLKHEFTHTVTLAATQNRIPHWFTEGLAVFGEDSPRSFAWRQMLVNALRRDQLFTLESIDWGFIRPRRPNDRQLAYAQSEWMCEYITDRFGYDTIHTMLNAYRTGATQKQVMEQYLKVDTEEFHTAFKLWARKNAANWGLNLAPPENIQTLRALVALDESNAAAWGRLARAEFDHKEYERALSAISRALDIEPDNADALEVFASIWSAFGDRDDTSNMSQSSRNRARTWLTHLARIKPDSWIAHKLLAETALEDQNWDRAIDHLSQLQSTCPREPSSWRGLAGIYLQRNEPDRALPQLLELARLDPEDQQVHVQIGRIYEERDSTAEAIHWYEQAAMINPSDRDVHVRLGALLQSQGDPRRALREYRMLTKLVPTESKFFEAAAQAANDLGDRKSAQTFAVGAVALDPDSDARSLLPD